MRDYLLKPFSFERFTKAVYKAIGSLTSANNSMPAEASNEKPRAIFIKSDGKNYPVFLDDILYCEAMKNYTMVILKNDQKLMPLVPLTKFEMHLIGSRRRFYPSTSLIFNFKKTYYGRYPF